MWSVKNQMCLTSFAAEKPEKKFWHFAAVNLSLV